jgi:hypothetical protein
MSITIEKIDETTYKVTVSDRTATTHMVTVAGASVIKCWQSDRNSSPWYSLRLNLRPSVLASTRPPTMKSLGCPNQHRPASGKR